MPAEYQVKIEVDNDAIVCNVKDAKVKGGNVQASAGDTVQFIGNGVKFSLAFASFPDGTPVWPFQADPPPASFWPAPQFKGVLKPVPPPTYYKYTVSVIGAPQLDPIIIVDK
jgi:hypothetical protein